MTKVLIVDDEPIVRLGLKALGDWESEGFPLEFEAANGKSALAVLEKHPEIGIIITDIDMPVMDGLELIKRAKAKFPNVIILVLSAYSDYELVRKSFKNGVFDYIIKSDMVYEKILGQLKNAEKELEKQNEQIQRIEEFKSQETEVEKYHLKEALLTGTQVYPLAPGSYLALSLLIDHEKDWEDSKWANGDFCNKVLNTIKIAVDRHDCAGCIDLSKTQYALIFKNTKKLAPNKFYDKMEGVIKRLRGSLENYMNLFLTVGMSAIFSTQEQLAESYQRAVNAANLRFFYGKGKTYTENDLVIACKVPHAAIPNLTGLTAALDSHDYDGAKKEMGKIWIAPEDGPAFRAEEITMHYRNVLNLFYGRSENRFDLEESFGKVEDLYQAMLEFETLPELNAWFTDEISELLIDLGQKSGNRLNDFIIKAKEYIGKNYGNPSLNVETVSSFVSVSPSHFSTTFARQIGKSFHEYLAFVRISKAKELIRNTCLKDYEIAQEIGIANSETFSRLFKKIVGVSSREYRKKFH